MKTKFIVWIHWSSNV